MTRAPIESSLKKQMFNPALKPAFLSIVLVTALLAGPVRARAVDVNRDGKHDFLLREQPYLPYANVGSNCDVWKYNSPWHARLYVRPPIVWGLPRLGRQRVAWRARFYDIASGQVRGIGNWVYATVSSSVATTFGGGQNAPQVMITWNQYWLGSQWYDHLGDDGDRIRALVDARWYNATTRRWRNATLLVQWVVSTSNRTNGRGQTGSFSGPVQRGTC